MKAKYFALCVLLIAVIGHPSAAQGLAKPAHRKAAERLTVSGNILYEAAVKANESSAPAVNEQNFKKALDEINKAVAADPTYEAAYRVRSLVYLNMPASVEQQRINGDLAVKDCESSITISAKNAEAFKCRGVAYDEIAGRLEDKFKNFMEEFTAKTYKNPKWFDSKGRNRAEVYALAIADFTTAISLKPAHQLYYLRAWSYSRKGDRQMAKADFAEAYRLNPSFTAAKNMLDLFERQDAEVKPLARPKPTTYTNIAGDWDATITVPGRAASGSVKLVFAMSGGLLSGKFVNPAGKSLDLNDVVVNPDRTFSFKMTPPVPGMKITYTGTVDAAFQTLTGTEKREMNGVTLSAAITAKRP